jgi:glycerol-3-phosphate acyltransferase PlsY
MIFLGEDVRQYGDGNPGATNAFRAGNNLIGFLALLLDISKAAAPVGIAFHNLQIRGIAMFLIAIAPMLGHIFSPFLAFKGGKALAANLGIWIGLTLWVASLPAVVTVVIGITLFTSPGWAVIVAMLAIFITLLLWLPTPLLLSIWAAVTLLLVWTHRAELRRPPQFRGWLTKFLGRHKS